MPRKAFEICYAYSGKQAQPKSSGFFRHWTPVFFYVVAQAWAKILPRALPKALLKWKNLIATTKATIVSNGMLIERWRRPSMLSSMCQHVARLQFDSCAKKDSLCGTVMMAWIWHVWINAIVFVPAAKAPPKAGAKELSYNSLNLAYSGLAVSILVSDQTDLFSFATRGDEYGMPRKALPRKQAKVDTGHQCFFCGCASNGQDSPKASPRVIFNWKNLIEQLKLIAQMNADWKVEKAQYAEFNVPTFDKIAVWQLCKERQPLWNSHDLRWPEFHMFGSMPSCSFPRQKLLPKLAQKNCHTTVWI